MTFPHTYTQEYLIRKKKITEQIHIYTASLQIESETISYFDSWNGITYKKIAKKIMTERNGRPDLGIIAELMSLEAHDLNPLFIAIEEKLQLPLSAICILDEDRQWKSKQRIWNKGLLLWFWRLIHDFRRVSGTCVYWWARCCGLWNTFWAGELCTHAQTVPLAEICMDMVTCLQFLFGFKC